LVYVVFDESFAQALIRQRAETYSRVKWHDFGHHPCIRD
jgi:hypothetical protein